MRQTTDNKSLNKMGYPESIVRGFELLTLFAGTFKCTCVRSATTKRNNTHTHTHKTNRHDRLYPYVMAHLILQRRKDLVAGSGDELDEVKRRIATLARRAQIRLQKTCDGDA